MDRPKDKTVVPPLPPSAKSPQKSAAPSSEDVIDFLLQHPDFLSAHPELLTVLTPPRIDRGAGVIDMQHFMVQRHREEIARVKAQQKNLIAVTRANLAIQGRVHNAALAILAAQSFEQLIQVVTTDLANLLDADVVTIAVERQGLGPNGARARLPHPGVQILDPETVSEVLGSERDVVLHTDTEGDPQLFGDGAGLVRSAAFARLPVSTKAPPGMLCIGMRKPGKFQTGQGTELLSFLARVLGITIAAWLDLPA